MTNSKTTIAFVTAGSSLGSVLVAASENGVCAIFLGDDADELRRDLQQHFPQTQIVEGETSLEPIIEQVVACIDEPARGLDLPLDVSGTEFEQRVWQALREIPAGTTASYSEIAARIGQPDHARAVGQACAANAIAVAIPCHRVVRADGKLAGYRWGVARKRALLAREAA